MIGDVNSCARTDIYISLVFFRIYVSCYILYSFFYRQPASRRRHVYNNFFFNTFHCLWFKNSMDCHAIAFCFEQSNLPATEKKSLVCFKPPELRKLYFKMNVHVRPWWLGSFRFDKYIRPCLLCEFF